MKQVFLSIFMMFLPIVASAGAVGDIFTAYANGLNMRYKITSSTTVMLYGEYSDNSSNDEQDYWVNEWSSCLVDHNKRTIDDDGNMLTCCRFQGSVSIPEKILNPNDGLFYVITRVGEHAFGHADGITSITLPSTVTEISAHAFEFCFSLPSISIPETVTTIGDYAFYSSGLETLDIPTSVGSIGEGAFRGCTNLSSVVIPSGIKEIEDYLFYDCSNLTEVTLGNAVTSIGKSSFGGTNLTSIVIPETVTTIDEYAFSGCKSLTDVYCLPENIPTTQINSFVSSDVEKATLHVPAALIKYYKIIEPWSYFNKIVPSESIIDGINYDINTANKTLTVIYAPYTGDVVIPSEVDLGEVYKVTAIAESAFNGCLELTSIIIPNSVTKIGNNAFSGCESLVDITIPQSVIEIGTDVFYNCPKLEQVSFENGSDELTVDLYSKVIGSPIKTLYLGRNVRPNISNPNRTFIPFGGINSLLKLTIGRAVTSFDPMYFYECTNLETLIIEDGTDDLTIGDVSRINFTFSSSQIQTFYLGRNVKGMTAPFELSYPFILTIGKNVTSLFGLANCTGLSTVEIPENVAIIEGNAFAGCSSLTKISIPNNVKEIGGSAFKGCYGLESITLPDNLETISWSLFDGCTNLTTVNIPDGVTDIGGWAFNNCSKLNSVTISSAVKSIGTRAFYGCASISSIIIPPSVTDIYGWAFYGCKKMTEVIFEKGTDSLEFWGEYSNNEAFKESGLSKVFLGRKIGYTKSHPLRKSPFANLETLKTLIVDIDIDEATAFKGGNIESVTITSNVTKLSTLALQDFTGLKSVVIEDSENILDFDKGGNFYHCPLESVYLGRNIIYISESPFRYNREGLKTLIIGDDVTELGEGVFSGHSGMTSLTLSNNLKTIGKQAFYGCEGLTSVSIPNSVMEIGEDAFDLTRGLTSFIVEDGIEGLSINNNFLNSPLIEVYLGRNIDYPEGKSPFSMLESLKLLKIGKDVDCINDGAFAGCQNLNNVVSYAVNVPKTGKNIFTESYLGDATLHVSDQSYKTYKKAYPWYLFKNYMLIDAEGNETPLISTEGDANGDGTVNAADIGEVVNFIMGSPTQKFEEKAADANYDDTVNEADIVKIVNMIMGN